MAFDIPVNIKSKDLVVDIKSKTIKVAIRGQQSSLLEGELHEPIDVPNSTWTIGVCTGDRRCACIHFFHSSEACACFDCAQTRRRAKRS